MAKPYLSLVLPIYNEGPTVEKSIKTIYKKLNSLRKPFEVIFVEDKSTDNSKETIQKILPSLKNTKAIYHTRNQGRGQTVMDGIKAARGEIVGFLDIDLEVSADYIPLFVKEIENGADMVVGKRFYEQKVKSITRVLASTGYALIVKTLLHIPISDTETGYKFFRRSKVIPILSKVKDKKWFWDTEICARSVWAGLKPSQVPVLFIRRTDKKSTVRLIPDTWDYLNAIVKFRKEVAANESR